MRPAQGRRIGLLGGSFDPVHQAHIALAHAALQQMQLDEVRWIPVGQAWQKRRTLAPAAHRLAMVRLATAHEPRFVVDAAEAERAGPSYTLETVRALQAGQAVGAVAAHWFLIIGQDQYTNLPTWHGWQELIQRVTLVVAGRPGAISAASAPMLAQPHRRVELVVPPMTVSSTAIRAQLAGGANPLALAPALVPTAVARYIARHQLYAAGDPR